MISEAGCAQDDAFEQAFKLADYREILLRVTKS
jgi:hypothetical protein